METGGMKQPKATRKLKTLKSFIEPSRKLLFREILCFRFRFDSELGCFKIVVLKQVRA